MISRNAAKELAQAMLRIYYPKALESDEHVDELTNLIIGSVRIDELRQEIEARREAA